ncbi:MAG: glycosyltransferase [Demequinaceae bacterium]|nr:glycosyltransferase [Demequinaceae bacterium]
MTPSPPEVSVVIPALNAEQTLGEQLAALSRQEAPFEWEIVVCDNGSRDGTANVVRDWQERLCQLRLVDASERRGPGAARNIGVAEASAALLLFCDADDVVADDWVVQMHRALREADFVAGGRRYSLLDPKKAQGPSDWEAPLFTKPFLPHLPAATSSNMGVRASVFREVGGFDESLQAAEDIDLCWRIQLEGHALVGQPEAIVHIRRRGSLAAIFKQAYAYGVGDGLLERKHADVIAATALPAAALPATTLPATAERPRVATTASDAPTASEAARPRALSRVWTRALRQRRPVDLTFAVDRMARRLGHRFGASRAARSSASGSPANGTRP